MSTVLAILLYLGVLNTTDAYYQSEINAAVAANGGITSLIASDSTLCCSIQAQYEPQVGLIHVVDEGAVR